MHLKNLFLNWSFSKTFEDETDSLVKAKCKILYTIFLTFFLKVICALITSIYFNQNIQFIRAVILLILYLVLLRCFLSKWLKFKSIAHIIVVSSLLLVLSNLYITGKTVNIITLQFVFTLIMCSFFIINARFGFIYSITAIIFIISSLLFGSNFNILTITDGSLASPGFEIIVILNFITIVYIPYLFVDAFLNTIKEKEDLNLKLLDAVKLAKEAAQVKSNFLSTMSHELRTPLNSVIGTTNLLLKDSYHPEQEANLNDLKFAANCLYNIVNDILDFNKLDSSKLQLENINVNINHLIESVCSSLNHQIQEKGIKLYIDLDAELVNYEIKTDPTRITQIIFNLLGNAIKFTKEGSVTVSLCILERNDDLLKIRFSVKDTGIGIGELKKELIFEPFKQESTSITRTYGGTGLGLAIVKKLLMLFNSKVNLESEVGKGSNFYFDINFEYQEKSQFLEKEISTINYDISQIKILVAEDNLMNRVLIKKVLSRWKNEPVFVENGREAVEISKTTYFDVILMDLHMPELDGYEASKIIRNDLTSVNYTTPIIAFTASVSDTILEDIKEAGMNDFIYKPFNADEMYQKLKAIKP